jgi:hypothetical protein
MAYTVKRVAAMSGVSVPTLRFYDETGLLKPAYVGANGQVEWICSRAILVGLISDLLRSRRLFCNIVLGEFHQLSLVQI